MFYMRRFFFWPSIDYLDEKCKKNMNMSNIFLCFACLIFSQLFVIFYFKIKKSFYEYRSVFFYIQIKPNVFTENLSDKQFFLHTWDFTLG